MAASFSQLLPLSLPPSLPRPFPGRRLSLSLPSFHSSLSPSDNYALSLMKIYRFCALAAPSLAPSRTVQMGPHSLVRRARGRARRRLQRRRGALFKVRIAEWHATRNGVSKSPPRFVILRPFADQTIQGFGVILHRLFAYQAIPRIAVESRNPARTHPAIRTTNSVPAAP